MNSIKVYEFCCRVPGMHCAAPDRAEQRTADEEGVNAGSDRIIAACFSVLLFLCFEARIGLTV